MNNHILVGGRKPEEIEQEFLEKRARRMDHERAAGGQTSKPAGAGQESAQRQAGADDNGPTTPSASKMPPFIVGPMQITSSKTMFYHVSGFPYSGCIYDFDILPSLVRQSESQLNGKVVRRTAAEWLEDLNKRQIGTAFTCAPAAFYLQLFARLGQEHRNAGANGQPTTLSSTCFDLLYKIQDALHQQAVMTTTRVDHDTPFPDFVYCHEFGPNGSDVMNSKHFPGKNGYLSSLDDGGEISDRLSGLSIDSLDGIAEVLWEWGDSARQFTPHKAYLVRENTPATRRYVAFGLTFYIKERESLIGNALREICRSLDLPAKSRHPDFTIYADIDDKTELPAIGIKVIDRIPYPTTRGSATSQGVPP